MSNTKKCIACAEEILAEAKLCKHCQTRQDAEEFTEASDPVLVKHDCNHTQTVAEFASGQSGNFWGGPKLKPLVSQHGQEKVVAVFPKVKYSIEGAFEEMMIVTESSVLFAGYGSFGGSESYPISSISALWLSDAYIGTGMSDTVALILDFETPRDDIEVRVIPLGTSDSKIKRTLQDLAPEFESLAAHVPVAHTGETVTGGYHTNFSFGFFREL
jgi:hypothetical protein